MQNIFYNSASSALSITTQDGYNYTLSDVLLQIKPDTGSFVAVSSSIDIAFFPIGNTNLFYKELELDTQVVEQPTYAPASFYWVFNTNTELPITPLNYLIVTSSLQTFVSQSSENNSGIFSVQSGSSLNVKADSEHTAGYDFGLSILDKTDNYTVLNQTYTTPLVYSFTPTASHYYEINLNITNNL